MSVAGSEARSRLAMRRRRWHRGDDHQVEYAFVTALSRQMASYQQNRARLRHLALPTTAALHLHLKQVRKQRLAHPRQPRVKKENKKESYLSRRYHGDTKTGSLFAPQSSTFARLFTRILLWQMRFQLFGSQRPEWRSTYFGEPLRSAQLVSIS